MYQIFSNESSNTYQISCNYCFSYCLFLFVHIYCTNHFLESVTPFSLVFLLGRFFYQLPISGPSFSEVIVSTPLSYFYQHTASVINQPHHIYFNEVIVPCTCIKSLIIFWYQLLLSLKGVCFPHKILVSVIPISYCSVTTRFPYSKSLPYQLLLLAITFSLLHRSFSGYSLQVLLSTISISYSFPLLSATLISYL